MMVVVVIIAVMVLNTSFGNTENLTVNGSVRDATKSVVQESFSSNQKPTGRRSPFMIIHFF